MLNRLEMYIEWLKTDPVDFIIYMAYTVAVVLISLILHECAHGWMALKCGDPTAKMMGRLSLNPARHLDPIGTLCMIVAGFGWANPVPINSRYFKKPRRDIALCSLAGPLSNVLLSLVFLLLLRFVGFGWLYTLSYPNQFTANVASFFLIFLYYGVSMNLTLAIFNLIPVPPLDGSRILFSLLPPKVYFKIAPYERQITIALMIVLLAVTYFGWLSALVRLIMRGLFALVGMKGFLI